MELRSYGSDGGAQLRGYGEAGTGDAELRGRVGVGQGPGLGPGCVGQRAPVALRRCQTAGRPTPSWKATYSGSITCGAHFSLNASCERAG